MTYTDTDQPQTFTDPRPDFLDQQRTELRARLDVLAPLVVEHSRLTNALDALDGVLRPHPRRRSPRTPGGKRAALLAAVVEQPGMTSNDLAERVDAHINYVYRLTTGLAKDGAIVNRDGHWYPTDDHAHEHGDDDGQSADA
jgi:hypothetical protein